MMNVEDVQLERGKTYGEFKDHMKATKAIMEELRTIHFLKDGKTKFEDNFEVALFYMVTKLVRLSTTPHHHDSALDLSSYAKLWLDEIERLENE